MYGFSPKKMRAPARVTQRGAKKAGPRTTLVNEVNEGKIVEHIARDWAKGISSTQYYLRSVKDYQSAPWLRGRL